MQSLAGPSAMALAVNPLLSARQDRVAFTRNVVGNAHRRRLVVTAAAKDGHDKNGKPLLGGRSFGENLEERIASGEFDDSGSTKEKITRPVRKLLAKDPLGPGRAVSYQMAQLAKDWRREAAERMPVARGDIREIVGQPVFVPLFKLFQIYGKVFRLSFGPKNFVVVSDAEVARHILFTNANNYTKGLLSEILEFIMGSGLIPADGEVWKVRRRVVVPALHKKYISAMTEMFGDCALHGSRMLQQSADAGKPVEMENFFSRLGLDIIGKAVFNYEFDSLTTDDPVIQAVYTTLREAEYRSTYPIPYWNFAPLRYLVPRQRECTAALQVISDTLDELIAKCKKLVEEEDEEFVEEFLSRADPSLLHFLIASGDDITSKQLRDDLMTLLIAGHETTAAVLTWTFHLIVDRPDVIARIREEVDEVLGDRKPNVEDMRALKYTTRVINESMRLYPQPPVLIRRAVDDDVLGGFKCDAGSDIFISTWNIHRNPSYWKDAEVFNPDRFPLDGPIPNEVTEEYRYLPFGGGKRKCIGDQFALFESIVGLAMLVSRFDFWRPEDAPEVGMTTGATIHTTNGLWLRMKPREDANESGVRHEAASAAAAAAAAAAAQEMAKAQPEVAMAFTDDAANTGNQQQNSQQRPT